jgi:hypothetical protein
MRISVVRTVQYLTFVILLGWWIFLNKNVSNHFYGKDGVFSGSHDGGYQPRSVLSIYGHDQGPIPPYRNTRGRKFKHDSTSSVILVSNESGSAHLLSVKSTTNRTINGTKNVTHRTMNGRSGTGHDDWMDGTTDDKSERQSRGGRHRNKKKKGDQDGRPQLLLPKPIIVMGFPKAGTSSIFAFFHKQRVPSQHWYDPKKCSFLLGSMDAMRTKKNLSFVFDTPFLCFGSYSIPHGLVLSDEFHFDDMCILCFRYCCNG